MLARIRTFPSHSILATSIPGSPSANAIHVYGDLVKVSLVIALVERAKATYDPRDIGEGVLRLSIVPGSVTADDDASMTALREFLSLA